MYEYNLLHLAASVLLAGTVDVLLHFLRLCGLDAIRLLRLLERGLVGLYVLRGIRLRAGGGGGAPHRATLLDLLVLLSDTRHALGKLLLGELFLKNRLFKAL